MKFSILAGAAAAGLALASPSYALDLTGTYLASFSVANGNQKNVCFQLTSTGAVKNYADEGTVTAAQYPNYSGYYVVYKGGFHLTFINPSQNSVTITGKIAKKTLVGTSATEFKTADGSITNVGILTSTASCSGQ